MNEKLKRKGTLVLILMASLFCLVSIASISDKAAFAEAVASGYINTDDFNVPASAIAEAINEDILRRESTKNVSWLDILAVIGAQNSCDFSPYKSGDAEIVAESIENIADPRLLTYDHKSFDYCKKLYSYVLAGIMGEYSDGEKTSYGIKGVFPIPIEYGYRMTRGDSNTISRKGATIIYTNPGTPVVAIESGTVDGTGYGEDGRWEITVRSDDNRRYYTYSNIMKDHPFSSYKEGDYLVAGETIGFVNGGGDPHLSISMCIRFDPRDTDFYENTVCTYEILKFLERNRVS